MLIHERLVELIERLPIYDSRIRRREPGGVHKMRVTLRRMRSLLATFAPVFDTDAVASLREELRWLGGELGGARDSQVVRKRLIAVARTPEERALAERGQEELAAAEAAGFERSVAALDSERYSSLLRDLNGFVTDPSWAPEHDDSTAEGLRPLVWRNWKRLRRRVKTAAEETPGDDRKAALHEVRKAAKRLRYSAEALVPAYGDDARLLARRAKRIQSDLGEVQDSAVTQDVLRSLASTAVDADEIFVLGGLHAQERLHSWTAEARYARAWTRLARKKTRQWLK